MMNKFILSTIFVGLTASYSVSTFASNTMTGDWGGHRSQLNESGVSFNAEYTNTYQGEVSGENPNDPNNAHRLDFFMGVDAEKLGWWQGGSFHTQAIYRNGTANDFSFTSLSMPNSAHYGDSDDPFISAFYYRHIFNDDSFLNSLLVGKIDAFEVLRHAPFYGGGTQHGFMNIAFSAPPSGVTPGSFLGAIAGFNTENINWMAMVYDPRERYTTNLDLSDAFQDGVNLSLTGTYNTRLFERGSAISVSAAYSTEEGVDYGSLQNDLTFADVAQNKYNFRVQLSHNLVEDENNPNASWGLYLRGAVADGNPNMFNSTLSGGLGGQALLMQRPQDSWGVGYYHYNYSNDLQDRIEELTGQKLIQNEQGFEAYYLYKVKPWLSFTADVQYVQPVIASEDKAWLMGLRTNIVF